MTEEDIRVTLSETWSWIVNGDDKNGWIAYFGLSLVWGGADTWLGPTKTLPELYERACQFNRMMLAWYEEQGWKLSTTRKPDEDEGGLEWIVFVAEKGGVRLEDMTCSEDFLPGNHWQMIYVEEHRPKPLKLISLSAVTELERQGHTFQLARSEAPPEEKP